MTAFSRFAGLFLLGFSLLNGCKKPDEPATPTISSPTVGATTAPTPPTEQAMSLAGTISANGGGAITQHGHAYSETAKTPTIADAKTELGTNAGPFPATFASALTGLKINTLYYVRAYATNSVGVSYGPVLDVKTAEVKVVVTVPMLEASSSASSTTDSVTVSSFRIQSTITGNGNGAITQHGHVYSTTASLPNLTHSKTELGASAGPFPTKFTSRLTGLQDGTQYNVRPYATNEKGTVYGLMKTERTVAITAPKLDQIGVGGDKTAFTLRVLTALTSNGGAPISQYGFVYSKTNATPTLTDTKVDLSATPFPASNRFETVLTGLTHNTRYYVRAYAVNSKGLDYSPVMTTATLEEAPTFVRPANFNDVPIYSLKLRIKTADVSDANTDDRVWVHLGDSGPSYALDHGKNIGHSEDDREKGAIETYVIAMPGLTKISDIKQLEISKLGNDGWKITNIDLIVNEAIIYGRQFSTYHTIDGNDGDSPKLTISSATLRSHANWSFATHPAIHIPAQTLTKEQIDAIVEGAVSNAINPHGKFRWSKTADAVEITYKSPSVLHVHTDLDDGTLLSSAFDTEFDLVLSCAAASNSQVKFDIINMTSTDSEFRSWFTQARIEALEASLNTQLARSLPMKTCQAVINANANIAYW